MLTVSLSLSLSSLGVSLTIAMPRFLKGCRITMLKLSEAEIRGNRERRNGEREAEVLGSGSPSDVYHTNAYAFFSQPKLFPLSRSKQDF